MHRHHLLRLPRLIGLQRLLRSLQNLAGELIFAGLPQIDDKSDRCLGQQHGHRLARPSGPDAPDKAALMDGATLAAKPPSGPDWVHEIKHDGYRLIVRRDGKAVQLFTRRGLRLGRALSRDRGDRRQGARQTVHPERRGASTDKENQSV
jgi:hypothetical protein